MRNSFIALALCASLSQDASPPALRVNAERASEGYTLFAPLRSNTTYLVDMEGDVVHSWEADGPPGQAVYVLYRWGNPRLFGAGTRKDQMLFAQHDATFLGGSDDLRVLVFNNGEGRPGGDRSSVDEIVLPFDPEHGFVREAGEPCGPRAPAWSYAAPEPADFYAAFLSGAQRLVGGNTLICSGPAGRLFEVTRDGTIVWDYLNPHAGSGPPRDGGPPRKRVGPLRGRDRKSRGALFRGTRIHPSHPGLAGRDLEKKSIRPK
ncbi:MAG: hypothetical protein GY711_27490 [bacterium]|nr:hypothetical protein [bacterium]